jgi:hypothetical protein
MAVMFEARAGRSVAVVAMLMGLAACSSSDRAALRPDSSPSPASNGLAPHDAQEAAPETTSSDGPSNGADASACSPYLGGLGVIRESRLPAGACAEVASCQINTRDDTCGRQKQWRCVCQGGVWACTLLSQDKLDCGPLNAGSSDAGLTSPEAAYCCPRDTVMSGCMRLGGVDEFGCLAVCDFWCSTNWRVEVDQYGCERWVWDHRMPAPGEDMECLPLRDAGAARPG